MHDSSLRHMKRITEKYLSSIPPGKVLDVGSQNVNENISTYRPIFENLGWEYLGLDMSAGKNVDIVAEAPYFFPIEDNSFDLVISGQAFEHIEYFWLTISEIERVLKPGGFVFLIAPSHCVEHKFPMDCWRFYPDGFKSMAKWAGLHVMEVRTDWPDVGDKYAETLKDTVGVFRKKSMYNADKDHYQKTHPEIQRKHAVLHQQIRFMRNALICKKISDLVIAVGRFFSVKHDCRIIKQSGLFDTDYYLQNNPDVCTSDYEPLKHFVLHGWLEQRDPNQYFNVKFYLEKNTDVAENYANPLLHYIMHGAKEGRNPSAVFSTSGYYAKNPDVLQSGMNPLSHYIKHGKAEGRSF